MLQIIPRRAPSICVRWGKQLLLFNLHRKPPRLQTSASNTLPTGSQNHTTNLVTCQLATTMYNANSAVHTPSTNCWISFGGISSSALSPRAYDFRGPSLLDCFLSDRYLHRAGEQDKLLNELGMLGVEGVGSYNRWSLCHFPDGLGPNSLLLEHHIQQVLRLSQSRVGHLLFHPHIAQVAPQLFCIGQYMTPPSSEVLVPCNQRSGMPS